MLAAARRVGAERAPYGGGEILVEGADRKIADDVDRPGDRKGGDRHAAGQRLDQDEAERVGTAGEDEDVGGGDVRRQRAVLKIPEKPRPRISRAQRLQRRTLADDDLCALRVEREKRLDVLLDGDTAGIEEDRPRIAVEVLPAGPEKLEVDAARPAPEIAEAACFQRAVEARRRHHDGL